LKSNVPELKTESENSQDAAEIYTIFKSPYEKKSWRAGI
jgi:hypothetical protein